MLEANSSDLIGAGLSVQSFSYELQTVPVSPPSSGQGSTSTSTSSATNSVTTSTGAPPITSTTSETDGAKESGLNKEDTIAIAVVVPVGFLCLVLLVVVIIYFARKGNYKAESPNSIEMATKKETPKRVAAEASESSSEQSRSSRSSSQSSQSSSESAADGTEETSSGSGSESNSSSSSD